MTSAAPLLAVGGLNAWYGEGHALHGVDLEVYCGETVTLLGRNGVGKTTTLRAIMGLIRKRTGGIAFDGQDLMRLPLHRTAHQGIGFVPEERGIYASLNVEENLMLPPRVKPRRFLSAGVRSKLRPLRGFAASLPPGSAGGHLARSERMTGIEPA